MTKKNTNDYIYYSMVLLKPFESVEELKEAEAAFYTEQKAKEDKAATKKADAKKVEDAFKALNAARRDYKESLVKLADAYQTALKDLKTKFDTEKASIQNSLAEAEESYATALKTFTDKYETYHFSLKGDDFETTISSNAVSSMSTQAPKMSKTSNIFDVFEGLFKF